MTALALAAAIEGMLYSVLPGAMQRMNAQVALLPASALRMAGLTAAILGVGAVWAIRS
ncbi:MAG TPA: DUF2065 domain-containing protein [Stellaceae bacterium]|nr:DUF2065 domain-containing protein [Stellaceae bacterium]